MDSLNKLLNSRYVFIIVAVTSFVPLHGQLPVQCTSESTLCNIIRTTVGGLKFLEENRYFLDQETPDRTPRSEATFDFIVIGAGTAGATIAARLTEIPWIKVLLIEAGSHENLFMDVPASAYVLQLDNKINWDYRITSSNSCLGMQDHSCRLARGKVMGGSSVLNYMIATRGNAEDYDRWEEMGNEGWAYKDVLKYFKKLETIGIPELRSDTTYHGTEGPVYISRPTYRTPYVKAFLEAGEKLGYPLLMDQNGRDTIGFSYVQSTIKNGTRMSSNRAYLHPVHDRDNLVVSQSSMVRRVLIDPRTKRAYGAEFTKNGRIVYAFARNEVILSAGTIGSAQLLMLSGVGPAEQLTDLGINVIRDAPVGENLMDHPIFFGLTWVTNVSVGFQAFQDLNPAKPYLGDYLINRSGSFTLPVECEAIGFFDTKHPEKRHGLPNAELLFASSALKASFLYPIITGFNDRIQKTWSQYIGKYGWTIAPTLVKPRSRGRIILRANNINVKPEIILNYFDDSEDVAAMIASIRLAINISKTETMQAFGPRLLDDVPPGCENYEYDSDGYWECALRTLSSTIFHVSGTCKMGRREDPTAVVDPKLKVIGIQGLRVADASIMPEIVSAHTNIPVFMIAEKLADMIKNERRYIEN